MIHPLEVFANNAKAEIRKEEIHDCQEQGKEITCKSIGARVTETQFLEMAAKAKADGLRKAHWLLNQLKKADLIDEVRDNLIEFRKSELEKNENSIKTIDKWLELLK